MRIDGEDTQNDILDLDDGDDGIVILTQIDLGNNYFIDVEKRCWTLIRYEKYTKNNGEKAVKKVILGFFGSLESLFRKFMVLRTKDRVVGIISLEQFYKAIKETQDEIHELCERIKL